MSHCYSETDNISVLVTRLQRELPDWTIDCAFDFGSNAKDEAVLHSDVDVWFLVHTSGNVLLDKSFDDLERYRVSRDAFTRDHPGCEVTEVDTWGSVVRKIRPKRPIMVSCPIADIRWFLWQLASENDWQTFLYTAFAHPLYDPFCFVTKLQAFLWNSLPFHIHPDHGIVRTLSRLCESEKLSLIGDLRRIQSQEAIELSQEMRPNWLRFAVECVRDAVSLLTLVQEGRPLFRRRQVLEYIESDFKHRMALTQKVYWYKCTPEGRAEFDRLLKERRPQDVEHITELTRSLIEFWHEIMSRTETTIAGGAPVLNFRDAGWREENAERYMEFLDRYLKSVA